MARKIKLFRGFLPNWENGIHYVFDDYIKFMDYATAHSFNMVEIDFTNYRLNNLILSVSKSKIDANSSAIFDYGSITYVIAYDEATSMTQNKPYFMAYHVKSFKIQSDNVIFELSLDYWASYIYLADFKKLCVNRCNKKIAGEYGLYDDIIRTKNLPTYKYFYASEHGDGTLRTDNVSLVMLIRTITSQNIFGTNYVSTDYIAYAPLSEFVQDFIDGTQNIDVTSVDLASRIAGGVYAQSFGSVNATDAKVLKAWLIPSYYLNQQLSAPVLKIKYKTCYSNNVTFERQMKIPRVSREDVYYDFLNNCEPSKKWYLGGFNNGLEIPNAAADLRRVFVTFDIGANDIVITASDGNAEKDITNVFEIPVIGQSEEQTTLEKISFWSKYIGDCLSDLQQSTNNFNSPLSAALGIGKTYLNFTRRTAGAKAQAQGQNGKGDGTLNYSCLNNSTWLNSLSQTFVYSPLKLVGFESCENEDEKANLEGISYACDTTFSTLFSSSPLNQTEFNKFPYLFLVADCIIDGIPTAARDHIANNLKSGLYLENIT